MVTTKPTMNGAVSSLPRSFVNSRVGVKGCLRGTKVSYKANIASRMRPEINVPRTFGSVEGRVVV